MESLTAEALKHLQGEWFALEDAAGNQVRLELTDLIEAPASYHRGVLNRRPFSLVFRGPRDRRLGQGTYRFDHASIGSLDIFIVPIAPDHDGQLYEAVFN